MVPLVVVLSFTGRVVVEGGLVEVVGTATKVYLHNVINITIYKAPIEGHFKRTEAAVQVPHPVPIQRAGWGAHDCAETM